MKGNTSIQIFGLVCCLLITAACAAQKEETILVEETFESQRPFDGIHSIEAGSWDYALNYTDTIAFRGKRSVRFEIREKQPLVKNGKRSEAVIIKKLPGREMWYSFAVLFPTQGFEFDSQREVISQWYQDGTPATSLRVRYDTLFLETGSSPDNRKLFSIARIKKDEWHEVVMHFIHSPGEDGLTEIWYDRVPVMSKRGGNMYDATLPKWKIGLYKASFKHGTSDVSRRVIFFDNVKVGDQFANYEIMRP